MMHLGSDGSITFTASNCYINKELLCRMTYGCYDEDGLEYPYSIFDLARDPSIIQKITETNR